MTIEVDEKHKRAYEALARMLRAIEAGKITGDGYVKIHANQGGVQTVKVAVEGE